MDLKRYKSAQDGMADLLFFEVLLDSRMVWLHKTNMTILLEFVILGYWLPLDRITWQNQLLWTCLYILLLSEWSVTLPAQHLLYFYKYSAGTLLVGHCHTELSLPRILKRNTQIKGIEVVITLFIWLYLQWHPRLMLLCGILYSAYHNVNYNSLFYSTVMLLHARQTHNPQNVLLRGKGPFFSCHTLFAALTAVKYTRIMF